VIVKKASGAGRQASGGFEEGSGSQPWGCESNVLRIAEDAKLLILVRIPRDAEVSLVRIPRDAEVSLVRIPRDAKVI
jgi:hypothetical protein